MPYRFRLAGVPDDPALRQLLRELPIAGPIRLRFEREPDYFAAGQPLDQTLVAESEGGQLVALATRGLRTVFVNGEPRDVGYLGQLRVHPAHQARWLLSRGFGFLKQLHGDGRCSGYLTTVTRGNRLAEGVLVGRPRSSFPRYHALADLVTLTYPVGRRYPRRAQPLALPAAHDRPQFFPVAQRAAHFWRVEERASAALLVPSERQVVVDGYSRWLSPWRALGGLPRAGTTLRLGYAAYLWAADAQAFSSLLDSLLDVAREHRLDYLSLGLPAQHPFLAPAGRRAHRRYFSRLYWVSWDPPPRLDERALFVEVGLL